MKTVHNWQDQYYSYDTDILLLVLRGKQGFSILHKQNVQFCSFYCHSYLNFKLSKTSGKIFFPPNPKDSWILQEEARSSQPFPGSSLTHTRLHSSTCFFLPFTLWSLFPSIFISFFILLLISVSQWLTSRFRNEWQQQQTLTSSSEITSQC